MAGGITFQNRKLAEGETYFVDEFNEEFNRDLEPQAGKNSDNYFYQLAAHVRRYKGMKPPPEASPRKTIAIDGRFDEWADVQPRFEDFVGELQMRDNDGAPQGIRYVNRTARNDIAESRVACDDKFIYFYVKTVEPMTCWREPNWMLLFIDGDRDKKPAGKDTISPSTWRSGRRKKTMLKRRDGDRWTTVAPCRYRQRGNEMEIAVPKKVARPRRSAGFLFPLGRQYPEAGRHRRIFPERGIRSGTTLQLPLQSQIISGKMYPIKKYC